MIGKGSPNTLGQWLNRLKETEYLNDEERRIAWELPKGCKMRSGVRLEPFDKWRENLTIGKDVFLGVGVIIECGSGEVFIGNGCHICEYTRIWSHGMSLAVTKRSEKVIKGGVKIGEKTWVGGGCIIYPDTIIGSNVIVLPNSVVNKDLPDSTIWAGVPVKEVKINVEKYK
jgi:acetyltransferase-like isoleucine patch superfamily enzyme